MILYSHFKSVTVKSHLNIDFQELSHKTIFDISAVNENVKLVY